MARIRQVGEAISEELAAVGINWNLANVVDTLTDLTEPSDAPRRYSDDMNTVTESAVAFAQGVHSSGLKSCAMEALTLTLQEVYQKTIVIGQVNHDIPDPSENEISVLRQLSELHALDSLMLSSCTHDFEDPLRSRRSIAYVVEHLIRGRLGFEGPIVTDCSLARSDGSICRVHAPLQALASGSDIVCLSEDFETQIASINAIYAAIEANLITRTSVAVSSKRVTAMKTQQQSLESRLMKPSESLISLVASHAPLMQTVYRASTTTLQSTPSPIISLEDSLVLLLLSPTVPALDSTNGQSDPFEPLGRAIARSQPRIRHVPYTLSTGLTPTHSAFLRRAGAVILVLACPSSALAEVQMEVWRDVEMVLADVDQQSGQRVKRIVVGAGDARDLNQGDMLEKGWWPVACWSYAKGSLEAVAEVLTGQRAATGVLPIRLRRNY